MFKLFLVGCSPWLWLCINLSTQKWAYEMIISEKLTKKDKFMMDILEICKKHKYVISHEYGQGCFLIDKYSKKEVERLMYADYKKRKYEI